MIFRPVKEHLDLKARRSTGLREDVETAEADAETEQLACQQRLAFIDKGEHERGEIEGTVTARAVCSADFCEGHESILKHP